MAPTCNGQECFPGEILICSVVLMYMSHRTVDKYLVKTYNIVHNTDVVQIPSIFYLYTKSLFLISGHQRVVPPCPPGTQGAFCHT